MNGTQYLMWWGTAYSSSSAGMNININNGQLRVRFGTTQTNIAAVGPNRWYHVLVSKDSSGNQVYINGQLSFSGSTFSLGRQQTEVVLGASEFMANSFTNCFKGSIAQATIWPSRLSATDAMVIYQSGEALFVPSATQALLLRADSANVTGPYPRPGAGSPWFDLANQHDATLVNFNADSTSGWQGNGTLSSPYRLAFDGVDDRVVIAAGTIPELQSVSTVSAAVWFHTGSDVTTNQCLLEWLGEYTPPFSGMSMVISGGYFRVMLDTWVDAMPVLPNAWYYMTVTKQPGTARIYVNGARCYTGGFANLGDQNSELVIGASTHAGAGVYGDYFRGSIAQVTVWRKALLDPEVQEAFHNDAAFFFGSGLEAHVVELRADSADGTTHYPKPGAASPWVDLARDHDATLIGFRGDGISGWSGDGMNWPYCLMFDGNGGCVTIPGGSVPELQQLTEASVSLWLHTGPDLIRKQYVLEWLQEYVDPYRGMTVRIVDGNLNVFLGGAQMLQALQPYTWYHVVVTKEPGVSRLYLNGQVVKSSSSVSLGSQLSEIVIGASTFRGAGIHGEFFDGAIAQAGVVAGGAHRGPGAHAVPCRFGALRRAPHRRCDRAAGDRAAAAAAQSLHPDAGAVVQPRASRARRRRDLRRRRPPRTHARGRQGRGGHAPPDLGRTRRLRSARHAGRVLRPPQHAGEAPHHARRSAALIGRARLGARLVRDQRGSIHAHPIRAGVLTGVAPRQARALRVHRPRGYPRDHGAVLDHARR